jgi:serine/threonine protein kinase
MPPILRRGTLLSGTYEIVRQIGSGGMGAVYEATHTRLPGRYAVKVLLAEVSDRTDIIHRFRREAQITSSLRHPNIVQIIDFNQTQDGYPYLVMELLEGTELAEEITQAGPMPVSRVMDIIGQAVSALTAAHHHKIVHRDLKPQNMFLVHLPGENREVVKIMDFGISKVREATTNLTQESTIMGTPQYMAPEQAQGRLAEIDPRTDEFALAVITYELLTGRTPFQGETATAVMYQIVHENPLAMHDLLPSISSALDEVVMKALSKSSKDRYPSVRIFYDELMRAASSDTAAPNLGTAIAQHSPPQQDVMLNGSNTLLMTSTPGSDAKYIEPGKKRPRYIWAFIGISFLGVGTATIYFPRGHHLALQHPSLDTATPVAADVQKNMVSGPPQPGADWSIATIEVEDGPPGLRVSMDGIIKSLPLQLPRSTQTHVLLFEAKGFEPHELRIDGSRPQRTLVLGMRKVTTNDSVASTQTQSGDPRNRKERPTSRHPIVTSTSSPHAPTLDTANPLPPTNKEKSMLRRELILDF